MKKIYWKSKIEKIRLKTLKCYQESFQIQPSQHTLVNLLFQIMEVEVLQIRKKALMSCLMRVKIIPNINKVMKELSKKVNKSIQIMCLKNLFKFIILKIIISNIQITMKFQ